MKSYLDANFLVRFYLPIEETEEPRHLLESVGARRGWPLQVNTLVRLEVTNAFQRLVFESRKGGRGRVTPEGALAAQGAFAEDLANAAFICSTRLMLEDVEFNFQNLVGRYTAKEGFRTYDILHVASALHLGCDTFWSFDAKALKLARLEGLRTNR